MQAICTNSHPPLKSRSMYFMDSLVLGGLGSARLLVLAYSIYAQALGILPGAL